MLRCQLAVVLLSPDWPAGLPLDQLVKLVDGLVSRPARALRIEGLDSGLNDRLHQPAACIFLVIRLGIYDILWTGQRRNRLGLGERHLEDVDASVR